MIKNNQQSATTLPEFKGVIKFELEVNNVYKKILETLPQDYKHREMVAHAVVGAAEATGQLGYIYNALAGFTNNIDFKIGETIMCTSKERRLSYDTDKSEAVNGVLIPKKNVVVAEVAVKPTKYSIDQIVAEVGICEIIDINLYTDKKLLVKFKQNQYRSFDLEEKEVWVNHKECIKWANLSA